MEEARALVKTERLADILLILPFALLYGATLCPGVYLGDSGELIAAARLLDIAHPPGYPLQTLIGRIATLAPAGSVAWKCNALSALAAAASVWILFRIARLWASLLPALLSALFFGLASLLWAQAVVYEVYTIHLFFFLAALFFMLRGQPTDLISASFFTGVALTTHPVSVALIPLWLLLLLRRREEPPGRSGRAVVFSLLLFALGMTLFLYLPIRSAQNPPTDWGDPESISAFAAHVFRLQYGDLAGPDRTPGLWMRQIGRGIGAVLDRNVPVALLPLLPAGLLVLILRERFRALLLATATLLLGPLLVLYLDYPLHELSVEENSVFFLPLLSVFFLFLSAGLDMVVRLLPGKVSYRAGAWAVLLLIAFFRLMQVLPSHRYDRVVLPEAYARDLIRSLPPGASLVTQGDDMVFPLLYLQKVEREREDVNIYDREGSVFVAEDLLPAGGPTAGLYYTFPEPGAIPAGLLFRTPGSAPPAEPERLLLPRAEEVVLASPALRVLWINYLETVARGTGERRKAITAREEALRLSPGVDLSPGPRGKAYAEATLLVDRGETEQAEGILRNLVAEDPGPPLPRLLLAEIVLARGERDEPRRLALETDLPTEPLLTRGARILRFCGSDEAAEELLREAIRLAPYAIEPRVELASLLLGRGETEGAAHQGREALQMNPASREARFILERALGDPPR